VLPKRAVMFGLPQWTQAIFATCGAESCLSYSYYGWALEKDSSTDPNRPNRSLRPC